MGLTANFRTAAICAAGFYAFSGWLAPAHALTIKPFYDSSITRLSNASTVEQAFSKAASALASHLASNAVINVGVAWGKVNKTSLAGSAVGESQEPLFGPYTKAQIVTMLGNGSNLPLAPATPNTFFIPDAEAKGMGLIPGNLSTIDGYVGFSATKFSFSQSQVAAGTYDFVGIAEHELSEVLGRMTGLGHGMATPYDLFRYSKPGVSQYSASTAAYFSLDRGKTDMGDFNLGGGDRSDWKPTSSTIDVQGASVPTGRPLMLSASDIAGLQALGYGRAGSGLLGPLQVAVLGKAGSVPEPGTWALLATGLAATGLLSAQRRRRVRISR